MPSLSSMTGLAGFAMIVLALALLARVPGSVGSLPRPIAAAVHTAPVTVQPGAECTEADDERLDGPFGLTVCRGWTRTAVPSQEAPRTGALIMAVAPGSEAAAAGFAAGDVIYRIAGEPVASGAEAVSRLTSLPHQMSVVNFWRDGMPFLIRLHVKP